MSSKYDFKMMHDTDLRKSVHEITKAASKLKQNIFKAVIMSEDINKDVIKDYMGEVSSFLNMWSEYADKITDGMNSCDPSEGPYAIEYKDVKSYLYCKYDFASIILFADGIFKGITNHKFTESDDIEDYFEYIVNKAFKGRADSVAGLLDEVFTLGNEFSPRKKASKAEAALFKSISGKDLFEKMDVKEIYKSIEKTAEYIIYDLNKHLQIRSIEPKLMISVINHVVEYMNYVLTAYATRIYTISQYVCPYIFFRSYNESVKSHIKSVPSDNEITVMRDANEIIFKDIHKLVEVSQVYEKFLKSIGSYNFFADKRDSFNPAGVPELAELENNYFGSKLISNELREFLSNRLYADQLYSRNFQDLVRIKDSLNAMTLSPKHAIENVTTSKQEMLHVIRGTKPEKETIEGYQKLASDLGEFIIQMLSKLKMSFHIIEDFMNHESNNPKHNNSALTTATELAKNILELYKELNVAFLYKARDIEMKINEIRNIKIANTINDLTIKIPGGEKSDFSSSHNMMSGVPELTRIPLDLIDDYSLPSLEEMTMYDEYVESLPGMKDFWYYNEAVNIKDVANALMAWLAGLKKKWDTFWTNRELNEAIEWCKKYQSSLTQMTFTPPMENIIPYKSSVYISHIDTLINKLNAFNSDVLKSQESLDKYIHNLYVTEKMDLNKIFNNDKIEAKKINELYRNWILFGIDPSSSNTELKTKTLNSHEEIKAELTNVWFENVAKCDQTRQGITELNNRIDQALTTIKSKIVGQKIDPPSTEQKPDEKPPTLTGGTENQTQQPQTTQQNNNENKVLNQVDLSQLALSKIELAIKNQYGTLFEIITGSIRTQYRYIQQAHSKGRKI